jgi:hypothetical protein
MAGPEQQPKKEQLVRWRRLAPELLEGALYLLAGKGRGCVGNRCSSRLGSLHTSWQINAWNPGQDEG